MSRERTFFFLLGVAFGGATTALALKTARDDAQSLTDRAETSSQAKLQTRSDGDEAGTATDLSQQIGDHRRSAVGEDELLLYGTISVHPKLAELAPSGGSMHLRIVCLNLLRPCMFKKLTRVEFPFQYEFRVKDRVSDWGLEEIRGNRFYVEAFYAPPGQWLRADRANQLGGEAWGTPGKPFPLKVGDRADIVIAYFWTPDLYQGRLVHRETAFVEGWIYATERLLPRLTPRNRLLVLMVRAPRVPGVEDPEPTILAAKRYMNIDPKRLLAYHIEEEDLLVPVEPDVRAYYIARLESFTPEGKIWSVVSGGRASPRVAIGIPATNLKIALHVEKDMLAGIHFNPDLIRESEPTYD